MLDLQEKSGSQSRKRGGELHACLLYTSMNMHRSEGYHLLLDIGTNGEMVLGNCRHMYVTSTSAGPVSYTHLLESVRSVNLSVTRSHRVTLHSVPESLSRWSLSFSVSLALIDVYKRQDQTVNDIDTSNMTDMSGMFTGCGTSKVTVK